MAASVTNGRRLKERNDAFHNHANAKTKQDFLKSLSRLSINTEMGFSH
jgi:hypothetical protein